jgi:protease IV
MTQVAGRRVAGVALSLVMCAGSASLGVMCPPASATASAKAACGQEASEQVASHRVAAGSVASITLEGAFPERPTALGLGGSSAQVTLRQLISTIDRVASGSDHQALFIRLRDAELTTAHIEEVMAAVQRVRASGKKTFLFAEGYDNAGLALGSAFDRVLLQAGGEVSIAGLYMEEMFLADMLKWVGVTPDFVQVGDYKGASEQFANSKPSPQWDQNINGLLDRLYANWRGKLKSGRSMTDAQLDSAMNNAWMATGEQAKKLGLIDEVVDLPEVDSIIGKAIGAEELAWEDDLLPDPAAEMEAAMANPFALFSQLGKKPSHAPKRDTIAVLHIDGAIVDGDSSEGGMFGGDGNVGSRTIRRALAEIEENDKIKGMLVRIDSPGGSAIASEVIWQGIRRVSEDKPVWVSIGDMAASGGYYIAVAGQKIYVSQGSIVGSIGVVGGKMTLGGSGGVYEKLKVNVVPRARGPQASLFGTANRWTDSQRDMIRTKMTETYQLFTSRVSAGRPGMDLSKTAEGRLFVGQDAVDLKMADAIGTFTQAAADMAASLNLQKGQYDLLDYPAPISFAESLQNTLKGFGVTAPGLTGSSGTTRRASGPALPAGIAVGGPISEMLTIARATMGEQNVRQMVSSIEALLQLRREPVILVSPRVLIFK